MRRFIIPAVAALFVFLNIEALLWPELADGWTRAGFPFIYYKTTGAKLARGTIRTTFSAGALLANALILALLLYAVAVLMRRFRRKTF